MDKRIITMVLAAVMVLTIFVSVQAAQKARKRSPQKSVVVEEELTKNLPSTMKLREQELELEERKNELDFEKQMRQLELMERKANIKWDKEDDEHEKYYQEGHHRLKGRAACGIFLGLTLALHILLAVWVYQDIRKRNAGSGLWIVIALMSGFFGVLLYAIVRLGDIRQDQT